MKNGVLRNVFLGIPFFYVFVDFYRNNFEMTFSKSFFLFFTFAALFFAAPVFAEEQSDSDIHEDVQETENSDFSKNENSDSECSDSEQTVEEIKETDISFDFSVLSDAIKHNGFGFGINGEYLFTRFFSVYGGFSHSALFSESGDAVYTTETVSLNLYCYPFGRGLNKYLYFGGGSSTEFIQLTGEDFNEENGRKSAIFIQSKIGWRQPLNKYIGLEGFVGYKELLYSIDLPKECEHLVDHGFFFGLEVHINFANIYKAMKKHFRKE